MIQIRYDGEHRDVRELLEHGEAALEEDWVTPEPIHDDAHHALSILGRQEIQRALDLRKDPAPIDVGDQHDPGIDGPRGEEVDEVARPQFDIHWRAGAFQDDHVVAIGEPPERLQRHRREGARIVEVPCRLDLALDLAKDDELSGRLRHGLEEDRPHVHVRLVTRGMGLQDLSSRHLESIAGDPGLVCHVLRLEWRHVEAFVGEKPAQPGGDDALAHVGRGAKDGQRGFHDAFRLAKQPAIETIMA